MKREFLEKFELEKDIIDAIMAENGKDINKEKAKYTALQGKYDELEEKASKYKDIDIEKLQKESNEWKDKYEKLDSSIKEAEAEKQFNDFLNESFTKFNVRDDVSMKANLDMQKIKEAKDDESKRKILEEQLTTLNSDKPFLFGKEEKQGSTPAYFYGPKGGSGNLSESEQLAKEIERAMNF